MLWLCCLFSSRFVSYCYGDNHICQAVEASLPYVLYQLAIANQDRRKWVSFCSALEYGGGAQHFDLSHAVGF